MFVATLVCKAAGGNTGIIREYKTLYITMLTSLYPQYEDIHSLKEHRTVPLSFRTANYIGYEAFVTNYIERSNMRVLLTLNIPVIWQISIKYSKVPVLQDRVIGEVTEI